MRAIIAIMFKDFKLLLKDKMAVFFTFIFPLIFAFFFGSIFSSGGGSKGLKVALADQDNTEVSQAFVKQLNDSNELRVTETNLEQAKEWVRQGKYTAFIILPKGFGKNYHSIFSGEVPEVQVGLDPSRKTEAGYLQGALMQQGIKRFEKVFSNPSQLIEQLDLSVAAIEANNEIPNEWKKLILNFSPQLKHLVEKEITPENENQSSSVNGNIGENPLMPLKITQHDISVKRSGPKNAYSITIPQGIIWAIMGCVIGFAVNLVQEKRLGTISRLVMAPISRFQIMAGKALGCFVAQFFVTSLLLTIAYVFLGVTFNLPKLILAMFAAGCCFVGVMMFFASIAKTERSVAGITNAFLVIMGMIGGAMIPLFVLPGWMQTLSHISPVKWSILALEGAIWRDFSYMEMMTPVVILISVGIVFFFLGTRLLKLEQI